MSPYRRRSGSHRAADLARDSSDLDVPSKVEMASYPSSRARDPRPMDSPRASEKRSASSEASFSVRRLRCSLGS